MPEMFFKQFSVSTIILTSPQDPDHSRFQCCATEVFQKQKARVCLFRIFTSLSTTPQANTAKKKKSTDYYFTFVKITPQRTLNSIHQKSKTTLFMCHSSEPKEDFQKYSRLCLKRLYNNYILSFKTYLLKSFKIWNTQIFNFMLQNKDILPPILGGKFDFTVCTSIF